ncbi:Glutamine synthetase adenylyltransferase [Pseudomonas syringae pv. actinidiae]|uniref:Glutamine synthetase adenylyltransferase n=1 Tax=Pseudomonas syringae pv. actinidiae TaxID=103796 RepID=A0AAN4Q594_PSESF|nr:Glutamine synthetase adenylyltransferase [Pseudomonas syringae pv. actinidiae]
MFVFKLFLTIILSSSSDKDDGFGEDANVLFLNKPATG